MTGHQGVWSTKAALVPVRKDGTVPANGMGVGRARTLARLTAEGPCRASPMGAPRAGILCWGWGFRGRGGARWSRAWPACSRRLRHVRGSTGDQGVTAADLPTTTLQVKGPGGGVHGGSVPSQSEGPQGRSWAAGAHPGSAHSSSCLTASGPEPSAVVQVPLIRMRGRCAEAPYQVCSRGSPRLALAPALLARPGPPEVPGWRPLDL